MHEKVKETHLVFASRVSSALSLGLFLVLSLVLCSDLSLFLSLDFSLFRLEPFSLFREGDGERDEPDERCLLLPLLLSFSRARALE